MLFPDHIWEPLLCDSQEGLFPMGHVSRYRKDQGAFVLSLTIRRGQLGGG